MKVIKKNEVETSEYPKRIVCEHCGAELEYDKDDEFVGLWGMKCITCPECNEDCFVSDHRVEPPNWKVTFDHTNSDSAVAIDDEEIQKYIDKCYAKLTSDEWKPGDHYLTGSGDTMIFGVKYEDEIRVFVTRDYYEDVTCL